MHGTEKEIATWMNKEARKVEYLKQLDLERLGIGFVPMGPITMFSVKGIAELFPTIDLALEQVGFCLVVDVGNGVFVEPWG